MDRTTDAFTTLDGLRASSTYQAVLKEGRVEGIALGRIEEARRLILVIGVRKLGLPAPSEYAALHDLANLDTLERVVERLLTAGSWTELLSIRELT